MSTTKQRQQPRLSGYGRTIKEIRPDLTERQCAGVEASMRLQYGTLDHLDRDTFANEIVIALCAENDQPGFLERVAQSYGL